jgi:hypothetical protein
LGGASKPDRDLAGLLRALLREKTAPVNCIPRRVELKDFGVGLGCGSHIFELIIIFLTWTRSMQNDRKLRVFGLSKNEGRCAPTARVLCTQRSILFLDLSDWGMLDYIQACTILPTGGTDHQTE